MMPNTIIYIALALFLGATGGAVLGARYERNACLAAKAQHQDQAQAVTDRRDAASATTSTDFLAWLSSTLPPIETTKYETVERIRTIYRDRPIPGVCVRPDSVQTQLDAARERANAAARRL